MQNMSDDAARKGRKKKARQLRAKADRKVLGQRQRIKLRKQQYEESYPGFVYVDEQVASPEFVNVIKTAIQTVDFDDESVFATWHRRVLREGKLYGFEKATASLRQLQERGEGPER